MTKIQQSQSAGELQSVLRNLSYCGEENKTINQIKLKIPFECNTSSYVVILYSVQS